MTSYGTFTGWGTRGGRRAGVVRPLFIALLTVMGCGQLNSPVAPEDAARPALQGDTAVLPFSPDGVLTFMSPPDLTTERHTSKLIKAKKGGFIQLGGFRVDIPARALARDTYVTIDLPTALPAAQYIVADFGPSGTKFSKPVGITLPLSDANLTGVDLTTVGVAYWNGEAWESYGGTATPEAVRSETTHFSTYGAHHGGIDTTSGG